MVGLKRSGGHDKKMKSYSYNQLRWSIEQSKPWKWKAITGSCISQFRFSSYDRQFHILSNRVLTGHFVGHQEYNDYYI